MKLSSSVVIERPAEEVFAVVSDFSRNPEWQRGMKSARWTSEPPVGVGSTYEQVAKFLGRDVVTTFEVTSLEPGRSITIESRESSFPIIVTRSVEPMGPGRSRVSADITGRPGRFFGLFGPLLKALAERSVRGDYERMRHLLENEG